MPSALVQAKFARPHLSPSFVERPALVSRLHRGLEGRVTLISAPAGFGKSILATQWLDRSDAPASAWLALDPVDSDLQRFIRYLGAALAPLVPGDLLRTEAFLATRIQRPPEAVADALASELEGMPRAVLVLDELEAIDGASVHAFLRRLVSAMGDNLHLVFVTRVDPPLPLSLWRTRFWLNEIRGSDLRFTPDEAGRIMAAAGMDGLSAEAVALLHRKTEGWAAGLRLAQLTLSRAADPEKRVRAFSGTTRLIADYLVEEVLAEQRDEIREFLGVTAHLDRFCPRLCDHVLSPSDSPHDSAATLDQLYANNVFLFPLGAEDGWYRFHPLFRQFLLDRATELAPERAQQDVLRRAGEWYEREGYVEEALRFLIAGNDLDAATDLVARHLHRVIDKDPSRRTLAQWVSMFPPGASEGRLPLLIASLYVHIPTWGSDAILRLLDEIASPAAPEDALRVRWREAMQADILAVRGYAEYWSGDLQQALRHITDALTVPRPSGRHRDSFAFIYRMATLASVGEEGEYERLWAEALVRARVEGENLSPLFTAKAGVAFQRGAFADCRQAALTVEESDDGSQQAKYWVGVIQYLLGSVAYERNNLDEAEARFGRTWALRFDTFPMFTHHAALGLAAVALTRGDHGCAVTASEEALEFANELGNSALVDDSEWFRRRLNPRAEMVGPAPTEPPAFPDFMRFPLHTPTQQWVFFHLHQPARKWIPAALQRLERCIARANDARMERSAVRLSIARALVLHRAERPEDAAAAMVEALQRAEPLGLIRSFVDYGSQAHELVVQAAMNHPKSPWIAELLEAFAGVAAGPGDGGGSPGDRRKADRRRSRSAADLTRREYSVLEHLQMRLSNKEVAARLFVSAETVRKHTVNIYRKLGVGTRREAVAKALSRGLLKPDRR